MGARVALRHPERELGMASDDPTERATLRLQTTLTSVGATSKVAVRVDGKVVRKVRLDGKAVRRLAFTAGKHTVKVSYAGSSSVVASSMKQKARVNR